MILTGRQIVEEVQAGGISIAPFCIGAVNPNSVNYRLGNQIAEMEFGRPIDPAVGVVAELREIPPEGMTLHPDRHYLATTLEKIGSSKYVPSLIGRSSLGRLGLFLQISADLGNLGACHQWTLELRCSLPLRIYPGMRVGQVSFWVPAGDRKLYDGYLGRFDEPAVPAPWEFAR